MAMTRQSLRCAVYTRKSSEEGLDQSFNSLEAQREASIAFAQSQKHEGWTVLKDSYDDGGFSGGTLDRPALKRLLQDIENGKVQIVIVYKVDRLTRSLTDFAKIIEIFDAHKVSFVSVTQQFNTTSSMGRLTLNVLLSFAQFEREITGERIRDKIAASKKKGMWMGGFVPLGYDCVERRLVINPAEAHTVREIFRQYLRLGSVSKLKHFLEHKQIRSKVRKSLEGETSGGAPYSRGALHHLLRNRIYIGETVHRKQSYPGQHQPIVPRLLGEKVASRLRKNDRAHRTGPSRSTPSLLTGKLFDSSGIRYTPTRTIKNRKRYRYYASQAVIQEASKRPSITRLPAIEIEQVVNSQMLALLLRPEKLVDGIEDGVTRDVAQQCAKELSGVWSKLEESNRNDLTKNAVKRVVLGSSTVMIEVDKNKLLARLLAKNSEALTYLRSQKFENFTLKSDFRVLHRGNELQMTTSRDPYPQDKRVSSFLKAAARAHLWYERIVTGEITSIRQLARESGLTRRYLRRILQCANLSPRITETLLRGQYVTVFTAEKLLSGTLLNWKEQEAQFFPNL
jgi:site-specific DNA recombinase